MNKTANIFGGYNPYGSGGTPPPATDVPKQEQDYTLMNLEESVRALVDVGHLQSKQEQVAALERRGIRLVKLK